MKYIYLHGFASSPQSVKALFYQMQFKEKGIELHIPDLNLADFSKLSFAQILETIICEFESEDVVLIGSSLGGLIALTLAERCPQVKRLILMAPALGINKLWSSIVGVENLKTWESTGQFPIYHYGYHRSINLHYEFIRELSELPDNEFISPLPTLIFHGVRDATIPAQFSRNYSATREYVCLNELDSDHSLEDKLEYMWQKVDTFLQLD